MPLFPIQRAGLLFRAEISRRDTTPAITRVAVAILAVLAPRTYTKRAEDIVAARYEGRAWCDTTERHLTCDIEPYVH